MIDIFYDKPVQVYYFLIGICQYYLGKLRNKKNKNFIIIFRNHEGCSVKRDTDTVNGK